MGKGEEVNEAVQVLADALCPLLPKGYKVGVWFEDGAGWVELHRDCEDIILPDSGDKSFKEQLNDAVCVANGF